MRLDLKYDLGDLNQWSVRQIGAVTRAAQKAGRDGLRAIKTSASRTIRFRKAIKVSQLSKALLTSSPKGPQTLASLEWTLTAVGTPQPVVAFPHRQTAQGVSVMVNKGKRGMIRSAFVATMRSGHKGVFRRRGKSRLPIDELYTTRVTDVFADNGMIPAVWARGTSAFAKTFNRVLPLELAK